jgi:hypothetical protein
MKPATLPVGTSFARHQRRDPVGIGPVSLRLVYDELRKFAAQRPVREQPGQTLQRTAGSSGNACAGGNA